jgi:hypothetical protein
LLQIVNGPLHYSIVIQQLLSANSQIIYFLFSISTFAGTQVYIGITSTASMYTTLSPT